MVLRVEHQRIEAAPRASASVGRGMVMHACSRSHANPAATRSDAPMISSGLMKLTALHESLKFFLVHGIK